MEKNKEQKQIDLSIEQGKTVIIDAKMMDIITRMFQSATKEEIKESLINTIKRAENIDKMYEELEENIYINKFTQNVDKYYKNFTGEPRKEEVGLYEGL